MTGPEHYRKAEKFLSYVEDLPHGDARGTESLVQAQVHATLALAAATAMLGPVAASGYDDADLDDWRNTTSVQTDGSGSEAS